MGAQGHVFAFDQGATLRFDGSTSGAGCTSRPCMNTQKRSCGCADDGCLEAGLSLSEGEHLRRWAVYKIMGTSDDEGGV